MRSVWSVQLTEECFSYSHFLKIQSETSSCFKAPLRVRPKQNNTRKNTKIVNCHPFSIVIRARCKSERIDGVFFKNTILDIAQLRGCLSVVRGTWNRPLPHVLGCFSSFAWILHVVGEKVRALPRPEGAMDKYTRDRVNRDANPTE